MGRPGGVGGGASTAGSRVSRRKAFFLSLLLPGLGQRASGHHGRARAFFGIEAAIWLSAGGFWLVGEMREDDYRQYAAVRAGADLSQDSEDYYQMVADYRSSDDYNVDVRRDARAIYPDDRARQLGYIAQHSIGGSAAWGWPDDEAQWQYRYFRHDALSAKRTSVLLTGWAVVNRVVSAIEAARSVGGEGSVGKGDDSPCRIGVDMVRQGEVPALRLTLARPF